MYYEKKQCAHLPGITCLLTEAVITSGLLCNFLMLLLSTDFFKINFSKNNFRNTIRVSNGMDLDQD